VARGWLSTAPRLDYESPVRMKKLQPDEVWPDCEARGWMERIIRELVMITVGPVLHDH
jgi:hypothetical protein